MHSFALEHFLFFHLALKVCAVTGTVISYFLELDHTETSPAVTPGFEIHENQGSRSWNTSIGPQANKALLLYPKARLRDKASPGRQHPASAPRAHLQPPECGAAEWDSPAVEGTTLHSAREGH